MAKPVWQQKLQDKLFARPLCFVGTSVVVKHVACLSPSEKAGKKISLRYLTNYTGFNKCEKCGVEIH